MRSSIKAKGKVNASVKSNIDITCEWQKIESRDLMQASGNF